MEFIVRDHSCTILQVRRDPHRLAGRCRSDAARGMPVNHRDQML
jgi:hypothetical protein